MEHTFRNLTVSEIDTLIAQGCCAENWLDVTVVEGFDASRLWNVRMSGKIRIGKLNGEFTLAGGVKKSSGIRNATLHNVTVGNGCCIENVKNYIANYVISDRVFIENVDCMIVDKRSTFGNGTEVSVLSETGGSVLDSELTQKLVKETFSTITKITIVPGFISSDKDSGETTNLGRGAVRRLQ